MNNFDPNRTPGTLAKHIPADVFDQMPRAEVVVPSAVVPAEYAARQNLNVVTVWTPDGREILVDVDAFAQQTASLSPIRREPVPRWVISTAILMPVTAGSVALGAWGLALAVPAVLAFAEALRQLFFVVLGIAVLVGVVTLSRPKKGAGEAVTVTATAVSRGLLSKATATATAIVKRR
ncbi:MULTISPECIES: hypothetical protein [Streptomyces]|uniref:hypothetical protein n=1 Tax=Streptomyces TaxID=1883 RepID=UPI0036C0A064